MLLLAVYVINLGYGFEGSLQRLGDYQFVSETFGGPREERSPSDQSGNRFVGTWLGYLPVPLPKNYLMGIDLQKSDFERKMWSYLRGEWRLGGWWYYYVYALLIKEPLGTWVLLVLAIGVSTVGYASAYRSMSHWSRGRPKEVMLKHNLQGYSAGWRNELVLLAPAVVVLVLVSSQTGFNHHVRYVLPALPFVFIWISKVARSIELGHRTVAVVAAAALCWSVGSSLYYYPHSLSYFNELVGGPKGGHYHLGNSNTDWGQDLFYLKAWLDEHPEAKPLTLAYDMPLIDPNLAGVEYVGRPPTTGPEPGWHAISVNQIHRQSGDYEYFLRFEPVGMAGYSIYIYHIMPEEANRVRRDLGLPELTEGKSLPGANDEAGSP
jgi:hypothetical protein